MTHEANDQKSILVVDDNITNVRLISEALADDYDIRFAVDGETALEVAASYPHPDLVLLDVMLPDIDGYEVCRRLKQNSVLSDIPVIFVSARTETDDKTKGFSLGAVDYVTKPVELPVLKARVKTHIKLREQQKLLETLSYVDPLTELANRRKYYEVIEREWKRGSRSGQPLSLLIVDIDYFKDYNDHYGHGEGDNCLRAVGQTIASVIARSEDHLARIGGEEFAIILPDCNRAGTKRVSQLIVEALAQKAIPHATSRAASTLTVSIGCATDIPSSNSDEMTLFNAADKALYEAKEQGRNRFVLAQ